MKLPPTSSYELDSDRGEGAWLLSHETTTVTERWRQGRASELKGKCTMRVSIIHDSDGNITGVVASPPDAPIGYLGTKPGERVSEMDLTELDATLSVQDIRARLANLAQNYRVEIKGVPTLTQKS